MFKAVFGHEPSGYTDRRSALWLRGTRGCTHIWGIVYLRLREPLLAVYSGEGVFVCSFSFSFISFHFLCTHISLTLIKKKLFSATALLGSAYRRHPQKEVWKSDATENTALFFAFFLLGKTIIRLSRCSLNLKLLFIDPFFVIDKSRRSTQPW